MINITFQNGYFSFIKDGVNIANNVRNDAFAYGNIVDFKTSEGAVISSDNISDVLVDGVPVSNVPQLFSSLYTLGYFDWIGSGGGGSGGVDRFTELLDAFGFTGNNGKVPVVNESLMRLDAVTLWNYKEFTELQDVAINELVEGKFVTVAMVQGEFKFVLGDLPSGVDLTGFVKNPIEADDIITFQVEGQENFSFEKGITRAGTEGRPIVGNLEMLFETEIYSISSDEYDNISSNVYFPESGGVELNANNLDNDYASSIQVKPEQILVNSSYAESKGIVGNSYFNKQNIPLAFAQMLDIANAVQSQTYDQTLGNGNTTDKSAIHENSTNKTSISPESLEILKKDYTNNGANSIRSGGQSFIGWMFGFTNSSGVFASKGFISGDPNTNAIRLGTGSDNALIYLRDNRIGFGQFNGAPSYPNDFNTQVGFRGFAPISETLATNANHLPRFDQVAKLSGGNTYAGIQLFNGDLAIGNNFSTSYGSGFYSFYAPSLNSFSFRRTSDGQEAYNISVLTNEFSFVNPIILGKFTTGTEPVLKTGALYFNTTKDRLMVGRSDGWLAVDELKSPNGSKWRLQVSDTGVLTTISA